MRPQPYIGITGFTHRDQINAVVHDALPADTDRLVMAGLLVSNRTLKGETNKWPNRYPRPELLKNIFPRYNCLLNLIHFNTKEPEKLLDDMVRAQDMVGPNCDGFQLNIAWPDPRILEQYKKTAFRNKVVVLQCGGKAIEEVGKASNLAMRLRFYDGLADYVLVDPSGGYGKDFNYAAMYSMLEWLYRDAPKKMGIGIAGGLSPDNLDRLRPLLEEFEFSIDAEGKLRHPDDTLDMATASNYLRKADSLFRERKQAA